MLAKIIKRRAKTLSKVVHDLHTSQGEFAQELDPNHAIVTFQKKKRSANFVAKNIARRTSIVNNHLHRIILPKIMK